MHLRKHSVTGLIQFPPVVHCVAGGPFTKYDAFTQDIATSVLYFVSYVEMTVNSGMSNGEQSAAKGNKFCNLENLTLTVPVTTIDALRHFETG